MTTKRDDGGPAFPVTDQQTMNRIGSAACVGIDQSDTNARDAAYLAAVSASAVGMSLRDYLAAKFAHAELLSAGSHAGPAKALREAAVRAGQSVEQRIAANAYELADAVLAERAKP